MQRKLVNGPATYLSVSPNGPTMITVDSHATTTVLLPHQTACPGAPLSPSSPRSNSDSDLAKSDEATQSCGLSPLAAERSERKRPLGEGLIWRNGPRVMCCGASGKVSAALTSLKRGRGPSYLIHALDLVQPQHCPVGADDHLHSPARAHLRPNHAPARRPVLQPRVRQPGHPPPHRALPLPPLHLHKLQVAEQGDEALLVDVGVDDAGLGRVGPERVLGVGGGGGGGEGVEAVGAVLEEDDERFGGGPTQFEDARGGVPLGRKRRGISEAPVRVSHAYGH